MQYDVLNRWTGKVQFTAAIECDADASAGFKLGLAVKRGRRAGADLIGADLSGAILSGADLSDADLRGADLSGAILSGADLSGAILSGADLSDADLRGADLSGAILSGADLSDADLRGAYLSGADLNGAILSGADLSDADLRGAYLSGADLNGAYLRDADLSGAYLRGAPKIENIHQAIYAAALAPDALDMGQWHNACGTAHCRAGWVVVLAGEAGKALEAKIGTPAAATLIYLASDPELERFPSFYCGNEEALADMKARAEAEAAKAVQS
jgi:uncharacterized protein YjbI with pentapeptide repeats